MVSINNVSVNSAVLASLRQTNAELAQTQNRIATGLKVASAKDNATVWSIAQGLRKDIEAQDGVGSSIALAKGQANVAYEALTRIGDILGKMKDKAGQLGDHASSNPGNADIQKELSYYQSQILAIAKSASIQGVNLLTSADDTEVKAKIGQDGGTPVEMVFKTELMVSTATTPTDGDLTSGAANLFGNIVASTFTSSSSGANKTTFINAITAAQATLTAYTARVANFADSLGNQEEFLTKVNDIRRTALSSLVDANMEEESARVSALQVKQQLAFQALSIGNGSAQNVLRLFQ